MVMKKKISEMNYSELYSLRCAAKSILDDLSEMATMYNVVNGNQNYDELSYDMKKIINERQEFYGYVQVVNEIMKTKIREEFKQ